MRLDIIDELGIPGIVDVHSHFMPHQVMDKVWGVFDRADAVYGIAWPITYRDDEQTRLATLRGFGVSAFTSLVYAHKPGMAQWLNDWCRQFALVTPDCLMTATFYPEDSAEHYVREAIETGARVFKVHVQVGGFDPCDDLLTPVWGLLAEAGIPAVVHCGSGPIPGTFTGPGPISQVLRQHPNLRVIVAHMGAPEYSEFLDLADRYPEVRLDTTMAFTDFMNRLAQFPDGQRGRLLDAGLRGDVLFGSDFPNIPYSYESAVSALVRLDLGDEWLRQVLHGAGARLFGLE